MYVRFSDSTFIPFKNSIGSEISSSIIEQYEKLILSSIDDAMSSSNETKLELNFLSKMVLS